MWKFGLMNLNLFFSFINHPNQINTIIIIKNLSWTSRSLRSAANHALLCNTLPSNNLDIRLSNKFVLISYVIYIKNRLVYR